MTDPRIWIDRPHQRGTAPIKSYLRMIRLACAISAFERVCASRCKGEA